MEGDDRRWMSQDEIKRVLEDLAASEMFMWLRRRGHSVDGIEWPDRDRKGRKGYPGEGAKTLDLTFQEDGHLVAVDILELHESAKHARQYAGMDRIVRELEQELGPRILELNPGHTVAISWGVSWLPPDNVMQSGLKIVKDTILGAVPGLRDGDTVDLDPRPDFIRQMRAICYASDTPTFGFMGGHVEQTGWVAEAVEAMVESLLTSSKPAQLQAFDDARVLAIDRALMPFPEDLRVAIAARADRIPSNWTAIYFVMPWRSGSLSEVWNRPVNPGR
jgi:hypothetical protein